MGFIFTPRLSFTKHAISINRKARARIGMLASRLPLRRFPFLTLIKLFKTYVFPIYSYGSFLWIDNCCSTQISAIDSTFTKFLKRYLGVPFWCSNPITHFITNTSPLTHSIREHAHSSIKNPTFFNPLTRGENDFKISTETYSSVQSIPTHFWRSKCFPSLPSNFEHRKALMVEVFDTNHYDLCLVSRFHTSPCSDCICKHCSTPLEAYHTCPPTMQALL